mmetsp:Transcript_17493/g.48805  ORF Transcript_17493/g.48805 Transcript_17493/m.48805 type:complete len:207 (+) Transcript_17493:271-891(+)
MPGHRAGEEASVAASTEAACLINLDRGPYMTEAAARRKAASRAMANQQGEAAERLPETKGDWRPITEYPDVELHSAPGQPWPWPGLLSCPWRYPVDVRLDPHRAMPCVSQNISTLERCWHTSGILAKWTLPLTSPTTMPLWLLPGGPENTAEVMVQSTTNTDSRLPDLRSQTLARSSTAVIMWVPASLNTAMGRMSRSSSMPWLRE